MSRLRNLVRKKGHEPTMRVRTFHSSKVVLIDENYRLDYEKEIRMLPEFQARQKLSEFLLSRTTTTTTIQQEIKPKQYEFNMSEKQVCMALDAAMATFHLHVESRIASLCGKGFYTIGPCGEELLSSAGLVFDKKDAVALHYRHLGISLARQLACNNHLSTQTINKMLSGLLLDRARGHTVSINDPVCGGVHCALGSNPNSSTYENDYVVTSTLASQCSPAVGRALGFALTNNNTKRVSFVTIGDGSIHNAHFLSSLNLAQHATYRNLKCPVIFGISDNGLSISYKTHQYTQHFLSSSFLNKNIPVYTADATNMWDVYDKTMQANKYSKTYSAPSILHYTNITRQFGHAATDRQSAYLTHEEISHMAQSNVLTQAIHQAVSKDNDYNITYDYLQKRFEQIQQQTIKAFNIAAQEPKITSRSSMMERLSPPLVTVPALPSHLQKECTYLQEQQSKSTNTKKNVDVMRKHMTRIITETMEQDENVVYIGEDVRHGGYYLVTDQISNKVDNHRIIDFPPDETTLLGAGLGLSQVGLTPIVEIPYSKYLDCGADMYYEIALLHWLTSKKNGMVIRLQGFDKGVFGGNFHTHNMISHIPPGVDVVCYSNGRDYVRGFRNAILQARNGRIVVLIDSTNLLNLRHLYDKDRLWETPYPDSDDDIMGFHDIRRYGTKGKVAIVTYGNGVVTSLRARKLLVESKHLENETVMDILDVPLLSQVSNGLKDVLPQYEKVIFADICKDGPGSNILSSTICSLQTDGLLQKIQWELVSAPRTYNPLGTTITFLNEKDIIQTYSKLKES